MTDEDDTDRDLSEHKKTDGDKEGEESGGILMQLPGMTKGPRSVYVLTAYLFVGLILLSVVVAMVDGGGGSSELSAGPDENLSQEEAAEYTTEWISRNVADRDQEAFDHYEAGVVAIDEGDYSSAIYELENAQKTYEELQSELQSKRTEYDEGQPRRELFDMAWRMYFLRYEGTSSRYNQAYAVQVKNDPQEALTWQGRADEHYNEASQVATEYHNTIDEWQGDN